MHNITTGKKASDREKWLSIYIWVFRMEICPFLLRDTAQIKPEILKIETSCPLEYHNYVI